MPNKSLSASTVNCAPPPRARPSSRRPRPTGSHIPAVLSEGADSPSAPAACASSRWRRRPPAARLHDAGPRHVGHHEVGAPTGYRRMALELLFVERNHICAVCVSNGHCELQALAQKLGVTHVRYPYNYPRLPVDVSHPRFVLDHNRCILCTRCVRVCAEIEGAHVWDIGGRGIDSRLVSELNRPWGESAACTSCGKCVQVCPTGALAEKGCAVEEMTRSNDRGHHGSRASEEARDEKGRDWRRCGWTAAPAATCRCSTSTRRSSSSPAGGHRLRAAGGRPGVPEDVDVAGGGRGQQPGRSREDPARSAQRTRLLVALGDCAVTGNVPAMRNPHPREELLERIYVEGADAARAFPTDGVPHAAEARRRRCMTW